MLLIDHVLRRTAGAAGPRLDHILGVTRRALGAKIAWLALPDNDRIVFAARAGTDLTDAPLTGSFSEAALSHQGGTIITDAWQNPQFRANPLVVGPEHIRFFAGYPVESPAGTVIGVLCILDSEPRDAGDVDLSLLREMARLVEQQLWRLGPDLPQGRARV